MTAIPTIDIQAWSKATNANNAARQVYWLNRQFQPARRWAYAPLEQLQTKVHDEYDKHTPDWDAVFDDIPTKAAKRATLWELCSVKPPWRYLSRVSGDIKGRLAELTQLSQSLQDECTRRKTQVNEVVMGHVELVKSHIRDFQHNVAALRVNPSAVADPHPENIRVVASVSQNYTSPGPHGMAHDRDLTLMNKAWVRALSNTPGLDDAISEAERAAVIPAGADSRYPDMELHIVSPVSTRRANPQSWLKQDNHNPYVRRIAVFIDDGVDNMIAQTDGIKTRFNSAPWWQPLPTGKDYRVDELIVVHPPDINEARQGITVKHKLAQAFFRMQQFAYQQRVTAWHQGIDPRLLQFEGYMSWQVHGMAELPDRLKGLDTPDSPHPERFQEGSMEFRALFSPGDTKNKAENVDESLIKQWERTYLNDFKYVVVQSGACCSGALTA